MFQVLCEYYTLPPPELQLPEVSVAALELPNRSVLLDLSLTCQAVGPEICCNLTYRTEVCEHEEATRLLHSFEEMLKTALCHPKRQIRDILETLRAEDARGLEAVRCELEQTSLARLLDRTQFAPSSHGTLHSSES
jgi:hypothetical protein